MEKYRNIILTYNRIKQVKFFNNLSYIKIQIKF
jgi:hypothetical protein